MNYYLRTIFGWLDFGVRRFIEYWTRRRSPAITTMRTGAYFVLAALGGALCLNLVYADANVFLAIKFEAIGGVPEFLVFAAFWLGVFAFVVGLVWEIWRDVREGRANARKRVLVIEQRGLLRGTDSPLRDAVPEALIGHRRAIPVDLTPFVHDGRVTDPERALAKTKLIRHDLETAADDADRADVSIVYGGVAPVPMTFLAGFLIGDEGAITIMDWMREPGRWRPLDGIDDGDRFKLDGLDDVPRGTADVAVAVEVSYKLDEPGFRLSTGNMPLVRIYLPQGRPDCHWSEEKQQALVSDFLAAMVALEGRGVRRIHMTVAAPNSVVFRLGRAYDNRNLPELLVYQYERSAMPPFPWSVRMPTHGVPEAALVRTEPVAA
ncbi:SAVED domain-containing protein [Azospirillum brasilense]|uniref:SAVED domain-containing protein n=1 Tax=Azospirillum brasilense TaxID=192 RepID=A0A6L3B2Q0_AZOBR|nr:SAVED domain-containing protein [Azospirillum brasilense]KAA0686238.1 SAVED domain-containing protein [Azospirillum brasilense]